MDIPLLLRVSYLVLPSQDVNLVNQLARRINSGWRPTHHTFQPLANSGVTMTDYSTRIFGVSVVGGEVVGRVVAGVVVSTVVLLQEHEEREVLLVTMARRFHRRILPRATRRSNQLRLTPSNKPGHMMGLKR